MSEQQYWIRKEDGRIWGPFGLEAVSRVDLGRGVAPDKIGVSRDGRSFIPMEKVPEILEIFERQQLGPNVAARHKAAPRAGFSQSDSEQSGSVDFSAFGEVRGNGSSPQKHSRDPSSPTSAAPKAGTAPSKEPEAENATLPDAGFLEEHSPYQLYSMIAAEQRNGSLQLDGDEGEFTLWFRKGTPVAVGCAEQAADLARFLARNNAASASALEEALAEVGPEGELVGLLISRQLIPPQDIFRHLGRHGLDLLDRALASIFGSFQWNEGAKPPPGSFELGHRWALLAGSLRKLPAESARERLGTRVYQAIYSSSGARVSLSELQLPAQELRMATLFDGTRSVAQIAADLPREADTVYRTALLMTEIAFVSYGPELEKVSEEAFPALEDDVLPAMERNKNISSRQPLSAAHVEGPVVGRVAVKAVAVRGKSEDATSGFASGAQRPADVSDVFPEPGSTSAEDDELDSMALMPEPAPRDAQGRTVKSRPELYTPVVVTEPPPEVQEQVVVPQVVPGIPRTASSAAPTPHGAGASPTQTSATTPSHPVASSGAARQAIPQASLTSQSRQTPRAPQNPETPQSLHPQSPQTSQHLQTPQSLQTPQPRQTPQSLQTPRSLQTTQPPQIPQTPQIPPTHQASTAHQAAVPPQAAGSRPIAGARQMAGAQPISANRPASGVQQTAGSRPTSGTHPTLGSGTRPSSGNRVISGAHPTSPTAPTTSTSSTSGNRPAAGAHPTSRNRSQDAASGATPIPAKPPSSSSGIRGAPRASPTSAAPPVPQTQRAVPQPQRAAPSQVAPQLRSARAFGSPESSQSAPSDGEALQAAKALLKRWEEADHFEVLGVSRAVTPAEAKKAFFKLAREHHPDRVAAAQEELRKLKADITARINEAHAVLSDPGAKAEYIDELEGGGQKVDVGHIFKAEEDFLRATVMFKARRYPEALELIEGAIELNPEEAEFYAWRGYVRFVSAKEKNSEYESSVADCRKALAMSERCAAAHLFLGHMAKILGNRAEAEKSYRKVLDLEPDNIEAQRELRLINSRR